MAITKHLQNLQSKLSGDLFFDDLHKAIYATDASVYRKIPLAVTLPKSVEDIQKLIIGREILGMSAMA